MRSPLQSVSFVQPVATSGIMRGEEPPAGCGTQPGRRRLQLSWSPLMHSALRSFFSSHRAAYPYPDAAEKPQSRPNPAETSRPPVFVLLSTHLSPNPADEQSWSEAR